jgi:hypothetical protein
MNIKSKSFLVAALLITGVFLFGQNVLKNGDFLKVGKNNLPADWETWPNPLPKGSIITVDTTNSYTGGKSVRIHNNRVVYTRIQQLNVKVKPHTWYLVSYYIKTENLTNINGGGPRIYIGPNGGLQYALTTFGPGINPEKKRNWSFHWRKYSRRLNTGKNKEIGVTLYVHNATGTVWFDNVQIIEITPDLEKRLKAVKARKIINKEIDKVQKAATTQNETPLINELTQLRQDLQKWFPENQPQRMKGLPFYSFQKKVYGIMGKILAKKHPENPIYISQANPFERGKWLKANPGNRIKELELSGLSGDIEQAALNFTNCSTKDHIVSFKLPENLDIKARQVVEVEVDNTEFIDDALCLMKPDKNGNYSLNIPAGMTKQLWLEIKLTDNNASISYPLHFECSGKVKTIDLNLKTYDDAFPKTMPIKTYTWGYPFIRRLTKNRIKECATDFKKHHINTIMAHQWIVDSHSGLPLPVFDKNGQLLKEKMDWSVFDKHLKRFPFCSNYIIQADAFWRPHIFIKGIKLQKMSPQWKACFSAWLKELVKGLKKRGIGYDRFALFWFDEPSKKKVDALVECAKIARQTDPNIRIFNNFHNALTPSYVEKLAETVDVVAPEFHQINPVNMKILKKSGKEIWMYWVLSKNTLPADIRKSFWLYHKNNIKGASFWCYSDNHQEWYPAGEHCYSVIYGGEPNELTPSKRWEAWREGVEDYTLLTMLKSKNPSAYEQVISKYETDNPNALRKKILESLYENDKESFASFLWKILTAPINGLMNLFE